ncbi:Hypothetical_protein [Hexamita inflata]|uniref:Hypothetical_protein n=1 Tax=Hexamita inflata TaxID=28002 RepID=A0AA86P0J1_9EUKA|nr:Hypothetical protein HINF_LOCUS16415 [Hexamita inflata]
MDATFRHRGMESFWYLITFNKYCQQQFFVQLRSDTPNNATCYDLCVRTHNSGRWFAHHRVQHQWSGIQNRTSHGYVVFGTSVIKLDLLNIEITEVCRVCISFQHFKSIPFAVTETYILSNCKVMAAVEVLPLFRVLCFKPVTRDLHLNVDAILNHKQIISLTDVNILKAFTNTNITNLHQQCHYCRLSKIVLTLRLTQ